MPCGNEPISQIKKIASNLNVTAFRFIVLRIVHMAVEIYLSVVVVILKEPMTRNHAFVRAVSNLLSDNFAFIV
jgi:hypothetical protein